ncbi:MAG: translation initiation factor IF-3 [SAR324 cluster bacterium]|nr:translation initiation factor IF-3 [SAR324 cluster bacterium]
MASPRKRQSKAEEKIRINERIDAPEVRVISSEGEQVGILTIEEALEMAEDEGLDLIEVSPNARPPVCRLMDFGKYKYQQSKKLHDAKKHQKVVHVKEIKLRPKTEEHDLKFKLNNAVRFLGEGNKVKVTVMFRGREMSHRDIGSALLKKFQDSIGEKGIIEQPMKDEGRSITLILAPNKTK